MSPDYPNVKKTPNPQILPKHVNTISNVGIKEIIHFYGDIINEKPNSTIEEILKFENENFKTITE